MPAWVGRDVRPLVFLSFWVVGGLVCAIVVVVLGDARPLLLSPCSTYHAGLMAVFDVTPVHVLRAGCAGCVVLIQDLIYSHERVQSSCGTVVNVNVNVNNLLAACGRFVLASDGMGRQRDTVLVIRVLCVHRKGMAVAVWFFRRQVYRFKCCSWAGWLSLQV